MDLNSDPELTDRVAALEEKVQEQNAHISGLVSALSCLLVAQAVPERDMRIPKQMARLRAFDRIRYDAGSTKRIEKEWFADRASVYDRILEDMTSSDFWSDFENRHLLPISEEKARKQRQEFVDAILRLLD